MELKSVIQERAATLFEETVETRRHIHAHPELSFEEADTAGYVAERLRDIGIPVQTGIAGHGIIGMIKGEQTGNDQVIALRADMDALPIQEENEVPYRSKYKGVMHACGHDVHTSSLLSTANILQSIKKRFAGTIKLVFQPAEERLPGGASLMIKDGVLEHPSVQAIYGQHVQPYLEVGKIGIRKGMYMASADEIYMTVKGKGGHAAHPSTFIDPIIITSQILVALQQVVSRSDPRIPSVLSFGTIRGEGATNVIPDQVYVEGTFRTMNEAWRAQAHQQIHDIAHNIAASFGATVDLDLRKGYPVLYNDEARTARAYQYIADYVGEENIVNLDLWMAAEDFAYYTQEIPGCFYRIGTRNEKKGITHGLHTSRFNIDEEVLRKAPGLMAWIA
ncbi:MAG: M20 family metallopeptidase, partial [Bacteroidota bacterium]